MGGLGVRVGGARSSAGRAWAHVGRRGHDCHKGNVRFIIFLPAVRLELVPHARQVVVLPQQRAQTLVRARGSLHTRASVGNLVGGSLKGTTCAMRTRSLP